MQRGATRRGDIWPKLIVASLPILIFLCFLRLNTHFSIGKSDSTTFFHTSKKSDIKLKLPEINLRLRVCCSQTVKIDIDLGTSIEISRNLVE